MEIHPPHPIHSLREFFLQLATITAGILIALALEGLVQWSHHRHLVHEAEANLQTEIRENRAELNKATPDLHASEEELKTLVTLVHGLQTNRKTAVRDIHFNWTLSELHSTSWNTAIATGAVGFMDYSEVKRYTRVYDLQKQFVTSQDRAFDSVIGVYGLTTLLQRDMSKISDAELAEAERVLGLALANAQAIEALETALEQQYSGALRQS